MKAQSIKINNSNLEVDTENGIVTIEFDQQAGEYTRQEWKESEEIAQFDAESQERILAALDITSENFFADEKRFEYNGDNETITAYGYEECEAADCEIAMQDYIDAEFEGDGHEYEVQRAWWNEDYKNFYAKVLVK